MEFFLCNKRKIAAKPTINQNLAASKPLFDFESWNCCIPCRHWLISETIKQPLSNVDTADTVGNSKKAV